MKVGVRIFVPLQPFNDHADHIMGLGMNHGRHPQLLAREQDPQDFSIVELHQFVRHVQLDTGDAVSLRQDRELIPENLWRGVREDEVEAIIAVSLIIRFLLVVFQNRV